MPPETAESTATAADTAELTPEELKAMQNAPEGVDASEIADMIAAVDAVKAGDAAPPPAAAPGKPSPPAKAAPEAEKPPEAEVPAFTATIRKLEAEQKAREEARQQEKQSASTLLDEARAEAERIKAEAAEYAKRERSEFGNRFKQRPLDALKEAGIEPDRLVNEVVKEGSPEWQLLKAQERELAELKAKYGEVEAWRQEQAKREQQRQEHDEWQHRQRVQAEFVQIANAERAPGLHAVAERAHQLLSPFMPNMRSVDDWKVLLGDHAAAQYRQASNGNVASLDHIVQHLNYLAQQQALEPASQQSHGAAPGQPRAGKSAGQSAARGPRTLSAASAGERRSAPKPPSQMSDEELHQSMIAAAEEALRQQR